MIHRFFLSLLLVATGCSAGVKMSESSELNGKVGFEAPDFTLSKTTGVFSQESLDGHIQDEYVERTGDLLLQQVLIGYSDQVSGFEYYPVDEAGVVFRINEVVVKRAYLTLNLPHPGPIYKVILYADIIENGELTQSVKLKQRINMAELNFPEESFKWMNSEEKSNPEYQRKTFRAAVRQLYQQLYFSYFNISLQL
jgi:hypothetical protein